MQDKIIITVLFIAVFGFLGSQGLSKESNLAINNEANLTKNWFDIGTCFVCKEAIIQMRFFLSNPEFEEKLRKYIRVNLCPKFGIFRQMCEDFVDNELADFFEDLEFYMNNPDLACMEMNFCTTNLTNNTNNTPKVNNNLLHKIIEEEKNTQENVVTEK
uniref:Saposin B-type domain-containing protein n=1 Tax=Meloidogyne javanica TaxID=6303 RepID=A0A915LKM2_MELJA